ncbi:chemotaxis protein CheA [Amphritea balenae]|uniref:Chemotaxis protein CheA n=1 Tax=Amphritea balenae TaxID=452629 RepID=A0A3P1SQ91_9GAMM|nr:chemotaxis protein CheA [Amphritea balenae]RRC99219.1 chemotaxis protein CheA [Amphritea balenae]GGK72968.1 chemotaxis protein CheA [Amphritea balenae]
MSLNVDQEILEDFLVEAGEILEQLSEQLVDLEQNPSDRELLNAIFRGFHTVKGGAGFLQLDPMVDCCHSAENLFDQLRNNALQVSSGLMDLVLQALDSVNSMFETVRNGAFPEVADPQLIQSLNVMASGQAPAPQPAVIVPEPILASTNCSTVDDASVSAEFDLLVADLNDSPIEMTPVSDLITEDEFEDLLDELHGSSAPGISSVSLAESAVETVVTPAPAAILSTTSDLITEDEFDDLLDELHGPSGAPGLGGGEPSASVADAEFDSLLGNTPLNEKKVEMLVGSELITDDEFENLMDDLQAQGKGAFSAEVIAAPVKKPSESVKETAVKSAPVTAKPEKKQKKSAEVAGESRKAVAETNVRVDTRLLDQIMNMVGELVLARNRLLRLGADNEDGEMNKALGALDMVTADLQMSVMKTRMQPVKKVFGRFPRLVRDLSRQLDKEVRLELKGEETDLDKNLVEALADPLIHLVRNAIDHGIETPDVRQRNGKPRQGNVLLSAEQEGDHILLVIEDDGAGMDPEKLRQLAIDREMMEPDAAARLTDQECFNLIFAAGFSTKKQISDVSGRGVGMDVVKTKITQLNGKLEIDSVLGQGSKIEIQVPLTLAIMPTLMVLLEGQAFALPLVNVNEIFNLDLTQINVVDNQQVIIVRDKAMPLFHLKRWLMNGFENEPLPESGHVVIANIGTMQIAFVVDQLVGQEEVVIKPLGSALHGTPGLSGATITGDGRIALILDIPSLLKTYAA